MDVPSSQDPRRHRYLPYLPTEMISEIAQHAGLYVRAALACAVKGVHVDPSVALDADTVGHLDTRVRAAETRGRQQRLMHSFFRLLARMPDAVFRVSGNLRGNLRGNLSGKLETQKNRTNLKGLLDLIVLVFPTHDPAATLAAQRLSAADAELQKAIKKSSMSWLRDACRLGHTTVVERHLAMFRADVNFDDGWLLRTACSHGHVEIVKLLLSAPQVNVNVLRGAPLTIACSSGHAGIVKLLLAAPRINVNLGEGLFRACLTHDRTEIVRLLLSAPGFNVNRRGGMGQALDVACWSGAGETVSVLLAAPRIDKTNIGPLLCSAISSGNTEIVRRLLGVRKKREVNVSEANVTEVNVSDVKVTEVNVSEANVTEVKVTEVLSWAAWQTVAMEACTCGNADVVRLLLSMLVDMVVDKESKIDSLRRLHWVCTGCNPYPKIGELLQAALDAL